MQFGFFGFGVPFWCSLSFAFSFPFSLPISFPSYILYILPTYTVLGYIDCALPFHDRLTDCLVDIIMLR